MTILVIILFLVMDFLAVLLVAISVDYYKEWKDTQFTIQTIIIVFLVVVFNIILIKYYLLV